VTSEVAAGRKQLLEMLGHRLRDHAAKYEKKLEEMRPKSSGEVFICLSTLSVVAYAIRSGRIAVVKA